MKQRVAILFDNLGPYHLARLSAAAGVCELLAVEFGASSDEYAWSREHSGDFTTVTLNPSGSSSRLSSAAFRSALETALGDFRPEVVFVPGWGSRGALLSLQWCLRHRVPAVVMSESTPWDAARSGFSEWVKGRMLACFSSALVGGSAHARYLEQLGFSGSRVALGYDVVDNDHFAGASEEPGVQRTEHYFLASARFVAKKNLLRLMESYALYRKRSLDAGVTSPWKLILLGDGPLRPELEALSRAEGLDDALLMPGFVQYPELPSWYAGASCFVHASLIEPWGLVVNEAMAAGLPVIVSKTCGCAGDLVRDGMNGWTFDPEDVSQLADLMGRISGDTDLLTSMGEASRSMISAWGTDRFAAGVLQASRLASDRPFSFSGLFGRILIFVLLHCREFAPKLSRRE